jgi:hypothetical protein
MLDDHRSSARGDTRVALPYCLLQQPEADLAAAAQQLDASELE